MGIVGNGTGFDIIIDRFLKRLHERGNAVGMKAHADSVPAMRPKNSPSSVSNSTRAR